MEHIDCLVVGAGVVGLACARALAQAGHEVWIVEREAAIGTGVSSRNSEVVHAGLYYPSGSRKARLCVRGRQLLYAYCAARGVPHRRCGKLVLAQHETERAPLAALQAQAEANGVDDLAWLEGAQAAALEPALRCHAALHSPASGIVDSHALMLALLGDAESAGALLALRSRFCGATPLGGGTPGQAGWRVRVRTHLGDSRAVSARGHAGGRGASEVRDDGDAGDEAVFHTRWIVNAAGLGAQAVAAAIEGMAQRHIPPRRLAKGQYFALAGRAPFTRLIYPLPTDGGLGVHLTLDLGGQAKFGPDVVWLPEPDGGDGALDYGVDPARAADFDAAVRSWWPGLPEAALQPAYSGIRPKLSGPGQAAADFRIDTPAQHGCAGLIQLFGIESPGLTAALAIAEHVAQHVEPHVTRHEAQQVAGQAVEPAAGQVDDDAPGWQDVVGAVGNDSAAARCGRSHAAAVLHAGAPGARLRSQNHHVPGDPR